MKTDAQPESDASDPAPQLDLGRPRAGGSKDRDIARTAETALQLTAYLLKNSIKATARDGWITLSGEVEWDYQRQTARNAVRHLPGVAGVNDLIKVRPLAAIIIGRSEIAAARIRHARGEALRISRMTRTPA